ncbi:Uncharacterized protein QTN25_004855 [Entamoeba marina]
MIWFLKHYKSFQSLQTLSIIIDTEMEKRYYSRFQKCINSNSNCYSVLQLLHTIHTICSVHLYTIRYDIDNELIHLLKSNSHIIFTLTIYSYNSQNSNQYHQLRKLHNVTLLFCCLNQEIIEHDSNISKQFNSNISYDCLKINSQQLMNDKYILNSIFDKMSYYPLIRTEITGIQTTTDRNSKEMKFDFKKNEIYEMELYLNSVNKYSIKLPTTLTHLLLFTSIQTKLFTIYYPNINLLNTNIQYLQLQHIQSTNLLKIYIPLTLKSIKIFNCKNIHFISSSTIQINSLSLIPNFSVSSQNCVICC